MLTQAKLDFFSFSISFFSSIFLMLDSFPSKRTVFLSLLLVVVLYHLFFAFLVFLGFSSFFLSLSLSLSCTKVFSAFFRKIFLKRDPTPEKRVRVRSEAIQI